MSEERTKQGLQVSGPACGGMNFRLAPPMAGFQPFLVVLWILSVLIVLLLGAANLWYGELNQDEGWYLYGARLVSQGEHPYIDFASTQGPTLSYIYVLAQPLVDRWSIAGGRLFTGGLGLLGIVAAAFLAAKLVAPGQRRAAALLAFMLAGLNVYQSYFFTIVKTYSLAALFLTAGFLCLAAAVCGRQGGSSAAPEAQRDSSPTARNDKGEENPPPASRTPPRRGTIAASPNPPRPAGTPPRRGALVGAGEILERGRGTDSGQVPVVRRIGLAFLAGVLMALAAATRISAAAALPVTALCLAAAALKKERGTRSGEQDAKNKEAEYGVVIMFFAGAVLCAAAVFLPFAIKAPTAFWFAMVDYHAGRSVPASLGLRGAYIGGFVSRVVGAYFVPIALLLAALVLKMWNKERPASAKAAADNESANQRINEASRSQHTVLWSLWGTIVLITLIHMFAPFPYDDYQAMIVPLFAAGIAVALLRNARSEGSDAAPSVIRHPSSVLCLLVFLLSVGASFSSPMNMGWFIGKRDRIWWPVRERTSLQGLRHAGSLIRPPLVEPGDVLLTQDPYLAIETGLTLPRGLELGPFSYFPEWPREQAEACHVLNHEMMIELLKTTDAPVAAFSDYGLVIRAPEIVPLSPAIQEELKSTLEKRYEAFKSIPNFGQGETTLKVYLKKKR